MLLLTGDVAGAQKENDSLAADVARLCEQLQTTTSAKLWKGLGYGQKVQEEKQEATAGGEAQQSEQMLLRLEVEVEKWQKQIYELRAEWEQERLDHMTEKQRLGDELTKSRRVAVNLEKEVVYQKATIHSQSEQLAGVADAVRAEAEEDFRRTAVALTQQRAQSEKSLASRAASAEDRAQKAEVAARMHQRRIAELQSSLHLAEDRAVSQPLPTDPGIPSEYEQLLPPPTVAPAVIHETPDLLPDEEEDASGGWTPETIAAMEQVDRFQLLLQHWAPRADTATQPAKLSRRCCRAILDRCRSEAEGTRACCQLVEELLAKLESARISSLSRKHRDIDVADIMVLSNARQDAVTAQINAQLPLCRAEVERVVWNLLLDSVAQRRVGNDYKWRLLKPAHDKEQEHKASLHSLPSEPAVEPAALSSPPSAEALAIVATQSEMGFLWKRGAINPSWKKMWFMLKGHVLCYFKQVNDDSPRGAISIGEFRPVDDPVGSRSHSFKLVGARAGPNLNDSCRIWQIHGPAYLLWLPRATPRWTLGRRRRTCSPPRVARTNTSGWRP
jgi:hypothetical protein